MSKQNINPNEILLSVAGLDMSQPRKKTRKAATPRPAEEAEIEETSKKKLSEEVKSDTTETRKRSKRGAKPKPADEVLSARLNVLLTKSLEQRLQDEVIARITENPSESRSINQSLIVREALSEYLAKCERKRS